MNKETTDMEVTGFATMASSIEFIDNYNLWMINRFRKYIGETLLEIGTGQGNFRRYFPEVKKYLSVDIDSQVVERARKKFPKDEFFVADIATDDFVRQLSGRHIDSIICANVIEHISEDARAIQNLVDVLAPDGHLLLFTPAFPSLYNDLDRLAGHCRRYTKQSMLPLVPRNAEIIFMDYFNPLGGLGWWLNKFQKHDNIDSRQVNRQVIIFDKYIVPLSRLIDPLTRGFFGQSLICAIKKN